MNKKYLLESDLQMLNLKFKSFQKESIDIEDLLAKASKLQLNYNQPKDIINQAIEIEQSVNVSIAQDTQERMSIHSHNNNPQNNQFLHPSQYNTNATNQSQTNGTYQNGVLTEEQKMQLARIGEKQMLHNSLLHEQKKKNKNQNQSQNNLILSQQQMPENQKKGRSQSSNGIQEKATQERKELKQNQNSPDFKKNVLFKSIEIHQFD